MQNSILCFSSFGQPSSTACQCFPHFHAPYPQSHVCLCRFVSIIQSDLVSSWILRRMEGNEANPDVIILFCFCVCSLDDTAQVLRIHGGYNSSLHSEKMCELKDGCATVSKKKKHKLYLWSLNTSLHRITLWECEFSLPQMRQVGFHHLPNEGWLWTLLKGSLGPTWCLLLRIYIERVNVKEEKPDHICCLLTDWKGRSSRTFFLHLSLLLAHHRPHL